MSNYMKRRSFLTGVAATGIAPHLGIGAEIMPATNLIGTYGQSKHSNLKISKVEILPTPTTENTHIVQVKEKM